MPSKKRHSSQQLKHVAMVAGGATQNCFDKLAHALPTSVEKQDIDTDTQNLETRTSSPMDTPISTTYTGNGLGT